MRPWLFVLLMVPCVCSALLLLLIAYVEVARSFRDRRRSQERAKRMSESAFEREWREYLESFGTTYGYPEFRKGTQR